MFNNFFKKFEKSFNAADDANLMADRKTAIVNNSKLGYISEILIYKKSSINDVVIGCSPIYGWRIVETIKDPHNRSDGFVVCIHE